LVPGLHVKAMKKQKTVYICINKKGGQACIGPQSREVFRALHKRAKERVRDGHCDVAVQRIECMGDCSFGPNVKIHGGPAFHEVTVDDVDAILDRAEQPKTP